MVKFPSSIPEFGEMNSTALEQAHIHKTNSRWKVRTKIVKMHNYMIELQQKKIISHDTRMLHHDNKNLASFTYSFYFFEIHRAKIDCIKNRNIP